MERGRPLGSQTRQHIIEILAEIRQGYGYEIYAIHRDVFPKCTMRNIYYHLRKGVEIGEIKVKKVAVEKGDYSWGEMAEKTYYALGENASPVGDERLKDYLRKRSS